ncbi:MAG: hypothetical protein JNL72_09805 [Flavipsychrobacter sp.]|nr:hypothetical protein [Flavipsychrobacter sp.]
MNQAPVSIYDAVYQGVKRVILPARLIRSAGWLLCLVLLVVSFSWWHLLLIPLGIVISVLYSVRATTRWRVWAYAHVADIHQFQRTAELCNLLSIRSYDRVPSHLGNVQRERLIALQRRFDEEPVFADDPAYPEETAIYPAGFFGAGEQAKLVFSEKGIWVDTYGLYTWDEISNERLAPIGFRSFNLRWGTYVPAGTQYHLRFDTPHRSIDLPVHSLDTAAWKLDLLLYLYQGRYRRSKLLPS